MKQMHPHLKITIKLCFFFPSMANFFQRSVSCAAAWKTARENLKKQRGERRLEYGKQGCVEDKDPGPKTHWSKTKTHWSKMKTL